MQEPVLRKIFLGFIQVHILHHAQKQAFYGSWMMDELKDHGYEVSSGTLYPILHNLERNNLIIIEVKIVQGKTRKYYSITPKGEEVLSLAKQKIHELTHEL